MDRAPALVVQTSYLGDLILTTPLLAELATHGPVDVVTTPAAAPLLANHPAVRSVIPYDKRGAARGMDGLWRVAHALKERYGPPPTRRRRSRPAESIDAAPGTPPVAYLAQGSVRSAMLAMLAGCRERVGFATSAGRALYTRRVPYQPGCHHAVRLLSLATGSTEAAMDIGRRVRLYPGPADTQAVADLLDAAAYGDEPLVAVAPGSAWATKRWPYYPALVAALLERYRVAIIGGPGDCGLAAEILGAAGPARTGVIDATGRLTPLATAALLGRCLALVANDSAPQHLASAMGTPTVSVFGPTVPAFGFGPLAPRHVIAGRDDLPCRPCDRHGPQRCPLGHWRCMRDIRVSDVQALIAQVAAPPHFVP